jgi:aromatic-L-amino-acid/L-tryptophan decarboxylase
VTPEEFRSAGHQLIDWIADYRLGLSEGPVMSLVKPGEVKAAFPIVPPTEVASIDTLLGWLNDVVVPGLTQVQHPRHFGWFPSNASLSSVLGDIASSGLGALGITWQSAPALTEVEEVTVDWMRQLTGLSDQWKGAIQDTASTSTLVAMLCARERASGMSFGTGGLQGHDQPLVVYSSPQAHSSIPKAVLLAGFGKDNLRYVETDPVTYALCADKLADAMAADVAAGRQPAAVIAAIGTTGTTAMDPLVDICAVASTYDAWVHVDAAMAGSAMLLPECRHLWNGVEGADSLTWNPHKWLGTILDCSLLYFRDPSVVISVMSSNPSYLRATTAGETVQYKDWGIPLGRRFRSLKLLFHLYLDGVESIRARLRRDLANAQWLAGEIAATPGWRVLAPVPLQTVCVRHEPAGLSPEELDAHTLGWVDTLNRSGVAFLTPAQLDGRWMCRVSIGVESTERSDVEALWGAMRSFAEGSGQ